MPMRATHSNRESVGKQVHSCSPHVPSRAGKRHKWFPTLVFRTQNVTRGTLVFLIFLNLTKTTLRKAEELGEALAGGSQY